MATSDSTIMKFAMAAPASGVMGRLKRIKPYPPIFNMIAARITEPPVGASTCASGNQVCTGHMGILTAKARRKAINIHFCAASDNGSL